MNTGPFLKSRLALAGVAAGLTGLLAFLGLHHLLILPIWGVAPLGIPVAALGGLAVAWAFESLRPRLPANGWLAAFAFVGLLLLTQAASFAVSAVQRPLADFIILNTQVLPGFERLVYTRAVVEMLVVPVLVGGAIGWLLGRSRQAAGRMALAALAFALGPGHNTAFFAGVPAAADTLWLLMLGTVLAATLAFGAVVRHERS
jgi:hypothetical protein